MMRKIALGLLFGCALIGFAADSDAFDTNTTKGPKGEHWHSIYVDQNFIPSAHGTISPQDGARNEHSDLTELTLQEIGADKYIGKISGKTLTVVDLNVALFRFELAEEDVMPGNDANRALPLEQRFLPTVPQWAGIPDFGYSVDDWINKHYFCPPRHGDGFENCHIYFGGWLSAFNSGHFGQQGADTYVLLHKTAMNLAREAKALRERIEASDGSSDFPGDRAAHKDKIEEAEMMAYYYEATAQHFLQDRWSTGHMWQRWNAPDVDQNPYGDNVALSSEVGAASGLLHGSEALTGLPDATSSPYFTLVTSFLSGLLNLGPTGIEIAKFRLGDNGPVFSGMGDERLQDWFDGGFGKEYASRGNIDVPVNISRQRGMMMECLDASWADVIRTIGRDSQSGGFGVIGVKLYEPFDRGYKPNHTCTDMWLTNESVALAWLGDSLVPFATMGRMVANGILGLSGKINPEAEKTVTSLGLRTDWLEVSAVVAMRYWRAPNSTDLAHGGLPPLGLAQQGGAYGPPNYAKHTDLNGLPDRDPETGTDKEAVFGFFNRARADYFCRDLAKRLKPWRGSKKGKDRATCHYLADRAWAGTDPTYNGIQKEERVAEDGQRAHAICQLFDGDARIATGKYDEDAPEYLHPGYTPIKNKSDKSSYGQDAFKVTSASVGNWCDKIPVLNFVDDSEQRDEDVVVVQTGPEEKLTVSGLQLGDTRGKLSLTTVDGNPGPALDVTGWSDGEVSFSLKDQTDNGDGDFLIAVTRADGVRSVGRFILRTKPERPEIAEVTISQKGKEVYHDEGDPEKADKFQLIDSGDAEITIVFKDDMSIKPEDGKAADIRLGSLIAKGEWSDSKTWRGRVTVPEGGDFNYYRGVAPLSVQAASEDGAWIDASADEPGLQPDTSRRVVLDRFPIFVRSVSAGGTGGTFYRASWSDVDLAAKTSIRIDALKGEARSFTVRTAKALPQSGEAKIAVSLSAAVTSPPRVTVGLLSVRMSGKDKDWTGSFPASAALPKEAGDLVQVVIGLSDDFNRNADADPRTLSSITLPPKGQSGNWWKGYEEKPGNDGSGNGGDDRWHKFGPPPLASLVVLLDGSGSMEDNNKMANAKQGLAAALDRLPEGFEIAAVTFSGCGSVNAFPFTRSKKLIKDSIMGIRPTGGTPLAAGIAQSRILLETEAHPLSKRWSFLPFSDGMENCNGNVGAEMGLLNAAIRRHDTAADMGKDEDAKASDDPVEKLPEVACHPQTRTAYEMSVRNGGLHLDTIYLVETVYQEKQDGGGNCALTLTTRRFGVTYGESQGKVVWRVNSKPSKSSTTSKSSRDGEEQVSAFREQSLGGFAGLTTMADARSQIDSAVHRSVGG